QRDRKSRAFAEPLTRGAHSPAVQLDYMTHDGESQPQPTVLAVRPGVLLPKVFEDVRQELRLDPLPTVGDDDLDVRVGALKSYLHAPAVRREFDRLGKQVPYDLLQPLRVP